VAAPAWAPKAARVLVVLIGIDLALQLITGLLTYYYSNGTGFIPGFPSSNFPSYVLHWANGDLLGLLAIVSLIVVALTRNYPNLVIALIVLLAIGGAGVAGMMFISSTPNPDSDAAAMGAAFVVAAAANGFLSYRLRREARAAREPGPVAPATTGA
jgi:hypothetical protein